MYIYVFKKSHYRLNWMNWWRFEDFISNQVSISLSVNATVNALSPLPSLSICYSNHLLSPFQALSSTAASLPPPSSHSASVTAITLGVALRIISLCPLLTLYPSLRTLFMCHCDHSLRPPLTLYLSVTATTLFLLFALCLALRPFSALRTLLPPFSHFLSVTTTIPISLSLSPHLFLIITAIEAIVPTGAFRNTLRNIARSR